MPSKILPDIGKSFGLWVVLGDGAASKYWRCRCACGKTKDVQHTHLRSGNSSSCGCNRETIAKAHTTHGAYRAEASTGKKKALRAWKNLQQRCLNQNNPKYQLYKDRGVYAPWLGNFELFYAEVGDAPSLKHSIDRMDNTLGYFPGNLKWATAKEQGRNTSRNIRIAIGGETRCLVEWCEISGVNPMLASMRIRKLNWSAAKAVTQPSRGKKPNNWKRNHETTIGH